MMMMATRKKKRRQEEEQEEEQVFDAVVCGGTLGVFLATALALKGMKVAIVERGPLRGVPYLPYLPLLSFSCTNFGFPFSCS
jgi:heterodisulfide reductase subunit A-like polyferredoxin